MAKTTNNNNELKLCVICMEREIRIIAIPCGHFSYCEICKDSITTECFVCRQPV